MKKWRIISIVLAIVYFLIGVAYGLFTVYMVYLDKPICQIAFYIFNCMWWGGLIHWSICFALRCRKYRKNEIEWQELQKEIEYWKIGYLENDGERN